MFSSFKVLRRKTAEDRKKDNRKSSSKWGLDRGLCQTSVDRVVDDAATAMDEVVSDDDQRCRLRRRGDNSTGQSTEVHEDWQEYSNNGCDAVTTRIVGVPLERDSVHGLGINLRPSGGQGPLVVTYVKPYGPADREGTIKVGDRLLAVDGIRLLGMSPSESRDVLMQAGTDRRPVWLTVEYDVSLMTSLRSVGRLLVEIESGPNDELRSTLGLSLIDSPSQEVVISRVRVASLAERCGAFQPGDRILGVNEYRLDENRHLTARDVAKILEQTKSTLIQIEILPLAACSDEELQQIHRCPSPYYDQTSYEDFVENLRSSKYQEYPMESELLADAPRIRVETGMVTLQLAPGQDYGLAYQSAPSKMGVIVCYVESSSAAGRSGVLQAGDRLLTANGRQISEDLTRLEDLGTTIHLTVQFDVEIWPLGGGGVKGTPKDVTLTRSDGSGFGVTITDSGEDGILVSNIKWGSVAHRCGRIRVGDRVVGIDDTQVQDMRTAMNVFRTCGLTVTFHLISGNCDLGYSSPGLPSVDSAVESWDSGIEPAPHHLQSTCYPLETDDLREIYDFRLENDHSVDPSVTVTVQSDDDETCSSSRRLSQDALESPENFRKNAPHFFVNGLIEPPPSPPCPLKTNYKSRKVNLPVHWRGSSLNTSGLEAMDGSKICDSTTHSQQTTSFSTFRGPQFDEVDRERERSHPIASHDIFQVRYFRVTLYKSVVFDDFGFSVSDGLYEKGVFVNTIKPGSPADLSNSLRAYDKIIRVNDVPTHDLDCCMTVPLMASAGKKLTLTVLRYNARNRPKTKVPFRPEIGSPSNRDAGLNDIRPASEVSVSKTETL